ncbi:MAG: ybiH [Herminiimonas sp.]|nr:ybiH [Herminiimonas sp.]
MPKGKLLNDDAGSKSRIVETALVLFSVKGVDRVSLRELTAQAGVNIAAVNYHFGSKEALVEAVFDKLAREVNTERMAELDGLMMKAAAEGVLPDLEEIVRAFIRPYIGSGSGHKGGLLAQMILKHRLEPSEMSSRVIREHFDPMATCFIAALVKASPEVDPEEFYWRYMFMVSSIVLTVTDNSRANRIARLSKGRADAANVEDMTAALCRFITGAMRAPGTNSRNTSHGKNTQFKEITE